MKLSSLRAYIYREARHQIKRALEYYYTQVAKTREHSYNIWNLKRWALTCLVPHFLYSSPLATYRNERFRHKSREKERRLRWLYGGVINDMLRDDDLVQKLVEEIVPMIVSKSRLADRPNHDSE